MIRNIYLTLAMVPITLVVGTSKEVQGIAPAAVPGAVISDQHTTSPQVDSAKRFIEDLGRRAITTLTTGNLSPQQQAQQFLVLLREGFDLTAIARLMLGPHWSKATPSQQQEFLQLLEDRLEKDYAAQFLKYRGVQFTVLDGRDEGNGYVIVNSFIQKPGEHKVSVEWRLRNNKIVDVKIETFSMAITRRSEYASIIERNGGKFDALLTALRTKAKS